MKPSMVLVCALGAPVLACGCAGDGAMRSGEQETEMMLFPIRLENHRPYIDVYVNGTGPFNFLIDTGASGDGRIDAAPVSRLELPVVESIENSDGVNVSSQSVVLIDLVAVGGFSRADVRMMTRDYNPPSRDPSLARLDGILGIEFFAGYVATVDFPRGLLVLQRGALNPDAEHVVAFAEPNQVPLQIGDAHGVCSIDTGSVVTAHFPKSIAESLVVGELSEAGSGRRAYTTFTMSRGRLGPDLTLAGNRISAVDAVFSDRSPEINIGSGLLSLYAVSIDAANRRFRIAPTPPGPGVIIPQADSP